MSEYDPAQSAAERHRQKQLEMDRMAVPVAPVSGKAGQILQHLHDGEPVFILRAQDILATMSLKHYLTLVEMYNPGSIQVEQVTHMINDFLAWQRANPSFIKLPD